MVVDHSRDIDHTVKIPEKISRRDPLPIMTGRSYALIIAQSYPSLHGAARDNLPH
ncbi:hypothetical protein MEG1DRAFT_01663 [Photorhabdus temperata subsp. temperata Meg1]|uniref:Uncharacterized protein n=1 Tax=Photorhabdus temperata subsp. temperata Meg1 TaxID=1393735 RepID=A0A081RYI6_PHOTE|nr:hypothetical protein MEG1DRAFT_01663 [Photorhabdus temperata subsp. temperata Meg1]